MALQQAAAEKIMHLDASQLAAGGLGALFREGAIGVVIKGDPRIQKAWEMLLPRMKAADAGEERLPWEAPVVDLARNHYSDGGLNCTGDVMHFSPGRIGYIGRKLELEPDPATGGLRCFPPVLGQGAASFTPDPAALDICWRIVTDLFSGLVGPGKVPTPFKAVVQRLKYQHSYSDIGRLCDLVESASGRWSQLGYRLDRYREMGRGPFAAQGLADIFALLCLLPWLRPAVMKLNGLFHRADRKHAVAEGESIIGKPHYDGRYFSALSGERDTILTQLFDGRRWHGVELNSGELLVIPGLAARQFGLRPTLHRVLHAGGEGGGYNASNITLLLGAK